MWLLTEAQQRELDCRQLPQAKRETEHALSEAEIAALWNHGKGQDVEQGLNEH